MTELSPLEKLRHFVNAAHHYADIEYNLTITILQEYEPDNQDHYVIVAMYNSEVTELDTENDNPICIMEVAYYNGESIPIPHNLHFAIKRGPDDGGVCLTNCPDDLSRLMFA